MLSTGSLNIKGVIWLIFLGALAVMAFRLQDMGLVFEDAAILMRYAEHIASGHGMVWNIGESPADGATDFLFVLVVAAFRFVGFDIAWAVRIPILLAHAVTIGIILRIAYLNEQRIWEGLTSVLILSVGPTAAYIAAGFGAPFFGMWAAWIVYLLFEAKRQKPWLIGFACLLLGLTRPEGVLLAIGMVVAFCLGKKRREIVKLIVPVGVCLFGVGGLYFIWRWMYFGHPLPTPFLKKGGFVLHKEGLLASWKNVARMLVPIVVLVIFFRVEAKKAVLQWWGLVVIGFTCIWVLMSDEMNYLGRFQYPVLVISACTLPLLISFSSIPKWAKAIIPLCLMAYYLFFFQAQIRLSDSRYEAALILQKHKTETSTLLTSEAGLLPLYSTWKSIDSWGLNDPLIARNGLDTAALAQELPQAIMFHAYFSPQKYPQTPPTDPWGAMVWKMDHFARNHGYELSAAWGLSADDTHHYYVLPNQLNSDNIIKDIQGLEYRWFGSGEKTINWK